MNIWAMLGSWALCSSFLYAEVVELTVQLHSPHALQSYLLYTDAGLPRHTVEALQFGLCHGGFLRPHSGSPQNWVRLDPVDRRRLLRAEGALWAISARALGGKVQLEMWSAHGRHWKSSPLTLPSDPLGQRRAGHALSDELHLALFQRTPIGDTRILYVVNPSGSIREPGEVWECDYDGFGARRIWKDTAQCISPIYVPAAPGKRPDQFAVVSYRSGVPKIYLVDLAGQSGPERLSTLPGNQFHPAFSPQRSRVAFISDAPGNPDLFVQGFSPQKGALGKARQLYPTAAGVQASPTFSPDGQRLAFVSDHEGCGRIYLVELPKPDTPLHRVVIRCMTKKYRENTAPAWSPDGRYLAYCAKVQGVRQIWICELSTGEERPLTTGAGHKENPSWAPDSLHLTFNTAEQGESRLYLVNLQSEQAVAITQGTVPERFPCWEPRTQPISR